MPEEKAVEMFLGDCGSFGHSLGAFVDCGLQNKIIEKETEI